MSHPVARLAAGITALAVAVGVSAAPAVAAPSASDPHAASAVQAAPTAKFTVHGTVTPASAPVGWVCAELWALGDESLYRVKSTCADEESGDYTFKGVKPGQYWVVAKPEVFGELVPTMYGGATLADATPITVSDADVHDIDIALESEGGTIEGRVTDMGGDAIDDVRVTLSGSQEAAIYAPYDYVVPAARTRSNGRYELRNLPPVPLQLTFWGKKNYIDIYSGGAYDPRDAETFDLAAGQTANGDVAMSKGAVIDGLASVVDQPDADVWVEAWRHTKYRGYSESVYSGGDLADGPGGRYVLKKLAPGDYLIAFTSTVEDGTLTQWYKKSASTESAQRVSVTLDGGTKSLRTRNLDGDVAGTLKPKSVTIDGRMKVGQTLTAIKGRWGADVEYTYAWFRNGVPIPGATDKELTLTSAEAGRYISVVVTGWKLQWQPGVGQFERQGPVRS